MSRNVRVPSKQAAIFEAFPPRQCDTSVQPMGVYSRVSKHGGPVFKILSRVLQWRLSIFTMLLVGLGDMRSFCISMLLLSIDMYVPRYFIYTLS